MILTRTPGLTVLGFTITEPGWQAVNDISEVVLNVDGKHYARPARYGLPEIVLDAELAAALEGGLKVSIAIRSEQDNAHRYDASLIGFTRAHECVAERDATISQSQPETPPKRTITVLPDDQRPRYTRGEVHALKQMIGMCLSMISLMHEEISMDFITQQLRMMRDMHDPEGLSQYFNKGVNDGYDRMIKSLEMTQK